MIPFKPSCGVALPRERNRATNTHSATEDATGTAAESCKPASLQELRAQLRAQLTRNQNPASDPPPPAKSCVVALPIEHNNATEIVGAGGAAADFDFEWFEERAAIYQFDAGFSRPEAEILARKEVTTWQTLSAWPTLQ